MRLTRADHAQQKNGFMMKSFNTLTILFALWLSIACYLPAIYLFTDALLLPKWYLFVGGVACLGMVMAAAMLRRRRLPNMSEAAPVMAMVFTAATVLECLYAGGCVLADGMRASGERGTFDTPAGLALSLCIAMPLTAHQACHDKGKGRRIFYGATSLLFALTLLLTRSRTGLLCLAFYIIVALSALFCRFLTSKRQRVLFRTAVSVLLATGAIAYVISHKKDSTAGRTFILQRSIELIKERPFTGYGHGGFEREYMLRQAQFFKTHPDDAHVDLADDIHHPLNEFIYLWVNYGILAPVALLVTLTLPLLKLPRGNPLQHSLLALLVFSCFSYPFHYPMAWLIAGLSLMLAFRAILTRWSRRIVFSCLLLLVCTATLALTINDAMHEHLWYRAYRHSFRNSSALIEYERLHDYFYRNPYFLYNYALASFMHKDLDRAKHLLDECSTFMGSYNQELLHGDVCFHQENYAEAITHYQMASHMCPVRFAPLEGLCKAYQATGDTLHRQEVAKVITDKKVKVNSSAIQRIKRQNIPLRDDSIDTD